jgi:hypothetical protein
VAAREARGRIGAAEARAGLTDESGRISSGGRHVPAGGARRRRGARSGVEVGAAWVRGPAGGDAAAGGGRRGGAPSGLTVVRTRGEEEARQGGGGEVHSR